MEEPWLRRERTRAWLPLGVDRLISAAGAARATWKTHRSFLEQPRGAIDNPLAGQTVARAPFRLGGWCLFPDSTVARVDITLQGRHAGPARLGTARPDIARVTRHPDGPICGFEYIVDPSRLPPDTRELRIGATARPLRGDELDLEEIALSLGPESPPSQDADGRAAQLRARVRPRFDLAPPDDDLPPLRLLCFAHQLHHTGSSLYLLDLVRRLAPEPGFACTVVALEDGPLRTDLEALGIPVHLTNGFPIASVEEYEGHLAELAAWAAPQGFNVAWVNTMFAFAGADLARRLDIPVVWSVHELPTLWLTGYPPGTLHPYVREQGERALRDASALLFVADATRELYLPYARSDRMFTLPYGLELEEIDGSLSQLDLEDTRRQLGVPQDATLLLCLGNIEPGNGQTMLAQAFRTIADGRPRAQVALVEQTDAERSAAYGLGLRHHVACAGLDPRIRLIAAARAPHPWLAIADVVVCASDVESLPRSLVQAMAFEKPVLSTCLLGVPELIEDGRTGYLCQPRDVGALATGLERVLGADPEERRAVARAGAARVRQRHAQGPHVERFGRLLAGLAADPSAAPAALLDLSEGAPPEPAATPGAAVPAR